MAFIEGGGDSGNSQYCALGNGMVIVALNGLWGMIRLLRIILVWGTLIQRLPMGVALAVAIAMMRLCYRWPRAHRRALGIVKWLFRVSLWFRGIRFTVDGPSGAEYPSGLHLCNESDPLMAWVLFAHLPTHHMMVMPDIFFSSTILRAWLFMMGFMPQEHGISPESVATYPSRMRPYIAAQYSVWQPVLFAYRDTQAIPYGLILAIMMQTPLMIWHVTEGESLMFAHWLRPRRIRLTYKTAIMPSKRMVLTIAMYHRAIQTHFGDSQLRQLSRPQMAEQRPPLPNEIAKKRFLNRRKNRSVSETESPGRTA